MRNKVQQNACVEQKKIYAKQKKKSVCMKKKKISVEQKKYVTEIMRV
jgi:hypothetical protein